MSLKLVSFAACPFVQRAVLMLREKDADFEVEYIDLRDKPKWFMDISPRGKVPVLIIDDEVLFESQAICEYLEEEAPGPKLFPDNAILRARDRAWFAIAGDAFLMQQFAVMTSKDDASLKENREKLNVSLEMLEKAMESRTWLSGDGSHFGMADVGFSSVLYTMVKLKELYDFDLLSGFPNLSGWGERMLARPTIEQSVPEHWPDEVKGMLAHYGSVLAAPGREAA